MTADKIKNRLSEIVSHFTFVYNGAECGVDPISNTHFDVWCGDDFTSFDSIDKVMNEPYFKGKPLKEIAEDIQIIEQ